MDKVGCAFSVARGDPVGTAGMRQAGALTPNWLETGLAVLIGLGIVALIVLLLIFLYRSLTHEPRKTKAYYGGYLNGMKDALKCDYPKCDAGSGYWCKGYVEGFEKHLKLWCERKCRCFNYAFLDRIRIRLNECILKNPVENTNGAKYKFKITTVDYDYGKMLININMMLSEYQHKISIDIVPFKGSVDISIFFRKAESDWIESGKDDDFGCWVKSVSELSGFLSSKDFDNGYVDYSKDRVNGIVEQVGKRVRMLPPYPFDADDSDEIAKYLYDLIKAVGSAGSGNNNI